MKEIFCTAKAKTNTGKNVFLGLLGSSMLLVMAAIMAPKFTGIIWTVAFSFVVATIYVYNRFVGSEYRYAITLDGGVPSFTVLLQVGKTGKIQARLDLDSIAEVRSMSGKEYRAYKSDKGIIRYPYFPTMFPETVYFVAIRSEHENADIFIEASEEFAEALASYAVGYTSNDT